MVVLEGILDLLLVPVRSSLAGTAERDLLEVLFSTDFPQDLVVPRRRSGFRR